MQHMMSIQTECLNPELMHPSHEGYFVYTNMLARFIAMDIHLT